jgi:DNA-binding Lrp family transcriptional regulator
LDALDRRIIKVLLASNGVPPGGPVMRKSFRSMAKDLRVDQGTIRGRMKKLQEQKVLKGWYLGISPAITGHSVVHAWLSVEDGREKAGLIGELLLVRGVERVCNYLGPKVGLVLLHKNERDLEACLGRISKIARHSRLAHAQGAARPGHLNLTQTDEAVVGELREDPWKPYSAVARELGISARTVKRRVTRLSEAGAIYMLPDLDLKALHGIIPVELAVSYGLGGRRAEVNAWIASKIRDDLVFSQISDSHAYFALIVPNASVVEELESSVRQLDGVSDAHTAVLQDVVLNPYSYGARPARREARRTATQKVPAVAP